MKSRRKPQSNTVQNAIVAAMAALTTLVITPSAASAAIPCGKSDEAAYPTGPVSGSTTVNGQRVSLTVEAPDASEITKCVISPLEYGTSIYFTVNDEKPVRITVSVDSPLGFRDTKRTFTSKYFSLEPTLLADEREKWPHYIDISDRRGGMRYELYLNHEGKVVRTRAYPARNYSASN